MADTTVENRTCQNCAADVRPQSLFCYNCGKSVAPDLVQDLPERVNVGENKNGFGQNGQAAVREITDKPIPNPAAAEKPALKSAAAMRRRPKSVQPKQVEIIWEERENAPNGWFILAAILLTLFAAGVLYLAMSFK